MATQYLGIVELTNSQNNSDVTVNTALETLEPYSVGLNTLYSPTLSGTAHIMTALEMCSDPWILKGALGAPFTLTTLANTPFRKVVKNNSGQAVTIIPAVYLGNTPVGYVLANGDAKMLYSDGVTVWAI